MNPYANLASCHGSGFRGYILRNVRCCVGVLTTAARFLVGVLLNFLNKVSQGVTLWTDFLDLIKRMVCQRTTEESIPRSIFKGTSRRQ